MEKQPEIFEREKQTLQQNVGNLHTIDRNSLSEILENITGDIMMQGNFGFLKSVGELGIGVFANIGNTFLHYEFGSRAQTSFLVIFNYTILQIIAAFAGAADYTSRFIGIYLGGSQYSFFAKCYLLAGIIHLIRIFYRRKFMPSHVVYSYSQGYSVLYFPFVAFSKIIGLRQFQYHSQFQSYVEPVLLASFGLFLKWMFGYSIGSLFIFIACCMYLQNAMQRRNLRRAIEDSRDSKIVGVAILNAIEQDVNTPDDVQQQGFTIGKTMINDVKMTYGNQETIDSLKHLQDAQHLD